MSDSERLDLRLFLKRLLLFSLPVLAYVAAVVLCDPFQFLGGPNIISEAVKYRSANPLNQCIWKMTKFGHVPKPNILLGDSKMDGVPEQRVSEITHEGYFNLAYGGASLRECIQTFWFATRQTHLHSVYFGISFGMYNDYNLVDRTEPYLSMSQNPSLYFINRTVLEAMAYSIYSAALHKDLQLGAPQMTKEQFWDYEVNGPETTRLFRTYLYPVKYRPQLEEIGRYAKDHGISLTFVILPSHTDFQARFAAFGLEPQKQRMVEDLAAIAPVLDFDYASPLASNANNFADPVHLRAGAVDQVVDEIWGNHLQNGRKY